jgi:hypothetical protein
MSKAGSPSCDQDQQEKKNQKDLNICKAWVINYSQNSVVGANQNRPTFWKRIQTTFTALMDTTRAEGEEVFVCCPFTSLTDCFQSDFQNQTIPGSILFSSNANSSRRVEKQKKT